MQPPADPGHAVPAGARTPVGDPGPFGNFYATIEGYTHEPGVRNVLRVDRYEIKDPPADAPSQAFVLDMVVESDGRGSK